MLDFDYMLGLIVSPYKLIGIGAIATAIIAAVPKCLSYYFDYRKTIHTNNIQLEIERLKRRKKEKPKVNSMRIDNGSS